MASYIAIVSDFTIRSLHGHPASVKSTTSISLDKSSSLNRHKQRSSTIKVDLFTLGYQNLILCGRMKGNCMICCRESLLDALSQVAVPRKLLINCYNNPIASRSKPMWEAATSISFDVHWDLPRAARGLGFAVGRRCAALEQGWTQNQGKDYIPSNP